MSVYYVLEARKIFYENYWEVSKLAKKLALA